MSLRNVVLSEEVIKDFQAACDRTRYKYPPTTGEDKPMTEPQFRAEIERLNLLNISLANRLSDAQADIKSSHSEGVEEAWSDIEKRLKLRGIDLLQILVTTGTK